MRGERPARAPIGLWGHDRARENGARELADETVRRALRYDWDFVKIQNRSQVFSECWGAEWRTSGETAVPPTLVRPAVRDADDLDRFAARAVDLAPLEEQLEALRLIRRGIGDDRPLLMTVFSPLMVLAYCFPSRDPLPVLAALRADATRARRVLGAIGEVIRWFAAASCDAGADGVYYATTFATRALTTPRELRELQRAHDLPVLSAVAGAPLNVLHVCGADVLLEELADYPVAVLSWAAGGANPDLASVRDRSGKAVAGGVRQLLASASEDDVRHDVAAALRVTGGAGVLLAPACSIDPLTPDAVLLAATAAARRGIAPGEAAR